MKPPICRGVPGVEVFEKQLGQQRQIVAPPGQGRQLDHDRAQRRGQVFAELSPPRQLGQRFGRGSHQPPVKRPPHKQAGQFDLQIGRNLIDPMEQQRARSGLGIRHFTRATAAATSSSRSAPSREQSNGTSVDDARRSGEGGLTP